MSYRDAIADILPRSTWIAEDGLRVVVACAAARHVVYRAPEPIVVHERDFRARFQPVYDRAAMRQQFTMSLANLGRFRVYWLPEHRRIMARSISCIRQFRVPPGAELVGVYTSPCRPDQFFDDLDDLIRRLAANAPDLVRESA